MVSSPPWQGLAWEQDRKHDLVGLASRWQARSRSGKTLSESISVGQGWSSPVYGPVIGIGTLGVPGK